MNVLLKMPVILPSVWILSDVLITTFLLMIIIFVLEIIVILIPMNMIPLLMNLLFVMMTISVLPISAYPALDVSFYPMLSVKPKICVTLQNVSPLKVVFKPISLKTANFTVNVSTTTVIL